MMSASYRIVSKARGFTLLELLIAMAIFAVIGAMALGGYVQLSRQSERLEVSMKRTRAVQMTMMRFAQDFAELEPRSVRDALGSNSEPAVLADARGTYIVQFTRAGWSNPAAIPRSTLQRVAYRVEDDKLYRDHWGVLDRTLTTEAVKVEMLDQVRSLKLRYMNRNRAWVDQWPETNLSIAPVQSTNPNNPNGALDTRPFAVEVTIELEDFGSLVRLIEVPG
jgi:general secretion pathway protein J